MSSEDESRGFTSNPKVGFWVGVLGIVIGAGISIYFYVVSVQYRRLVFFLDPVRTEIVRPGEVANLRVLYGDQELKKGVTAAQVAIWNAGNLPIKPDNCVWQLILAHFGGLIWPTLGRCGFGEAF